MLLFMAAYSAGVAPTATSQATRTLDCRNPDQYRLVVVDNPKNLPIKKFVMIKYL